MCFLCDRRLPKWHFSWSLRPACLCCTTSRPDPRIKIMLASVEIKSQSSMSRNQHHTAPNTLKYTSSEIVLFIQLIYLQNSAVLRLKLQKPLIALLSFSGTYVTKLYKIYITRCRLYTSTVISKIAPVLEPPKFFTSVAYPVFKYVYSS